jgi:hypothetical protein
VRRQRLKLSPLLPRDDRSDEMMRRIHASVWFSFEGACEAIAEASRKAKAAAG